MANHSSILAWKIPWTEEPGWLQSMGLQRVGHDWVTNTYSTYKLNKQGDNTEPRCTHFPVLNQCIVPCSRRQVRWSGIPISLRIFQFVVIHTVKAFCIVNEAKVDIFLEFSCFFLWSRDEDYSLNVAVIIVPVHYGPIIYVVFINLSKVPPQYHKSVTVWKTMED